MYNVRFVMSLLYRMVNPFFFVFGRLNNDVSQEMCTERMEHNSFDAPSCSPFQQRSLLEEVSFYTAIALKVILSFILASTTCRDLIYYTHLYLTHTIYYTTC